MGTQRLMLMFSHWKGKGKGSRCPQWEVVKIVSKMSERVDRERELILDRDEHEHRRPFLMLRVSQLKPRQGTLLVRTELLFLRSPSLCFCLAPFAPQYQNQ